MHVILSPRSSRLFGKCQEDTVKIRLEGNGRYNTFNVQCTNSMIFHLAILKIWHKINNNTVSGNIGGN